MRRRRNEVVVMQMSLTVLLVIGMKEDVMDASVKINNANIEHNTQILHKKTKTSLSLCDLLHFLLYTTLMLYFDLHISQQAFSKSVNFFCIHEFKQSLWTYF